MPETDRRHTRDKHCFTYLQRRIFFPQRASLNQIKISFRFNLPQEGYFFIHKQNVMDDDRLFRWHRVDHGDTIDIFNGSRGLQFSIEVGYFDTVLEIKEKVEKFQRIPVSKQTLFFQGNVLQENLDIEQCQILHNSRLQLLICTPSTDQSASTLVFKTDQSPPSNSTEQIITVHQDPSVMMSGSNHNNNNNNNNNNSTKKLRVMVSLKCGTRKFPVEVNACDKVGELRKELANIQQRFRFNLPQEGYFFIHKQNVMGDDRSFRWHRVDHGDNIDIFNGSVSGGSS
ncbi:unnamed protein product [Brassica napus]|uniref:(rape) hypothetical protein n=1 Tax=Brassica napus TaxID=3708 RepID=A0A816KG80_BRANA|nr:unnamed protein product [Brassica napus]